MQDIINFFIIIFGLVILAGAALFLDAEVFLSMQRSKTNNEGLSFLTAGPRVKKITGMSIIITGLVMIIILKAMLLSQ